MRILFLTQLLPYPLDAGAKVRAYYTLRHLCGHHEVTLLSFVRDSDSALAREHLRSFCAALYTVPISRSRLSDAWYFLRSRAGRTPFLIARDWSGAMAERLAEVVRGGGPFDAVHADQLWMAPYALLAASLQPRPARPLTILDQHNAVFQIPRRMAEAGGSRLKTWALASEARKMADYEVRACRQFDRVVFVTGEDRAALAGCGFDAAAPATAVIPICLQPRATDGGGQARRKRRVTFLGVMNWPPNAQGASWFERLVWPYVRAEAADSLFTIIGRNPPASLGNRPGDRIEVAGYVADPEPYLRETAAFVVPLLAGGGMRVKILEAWAKGVPVVSTTIGAEGLRVSHGGDILLADTPADFARQVVRLLRDPALGENLARRGRQTLAAHYDWRKVYPAWDEVYKCGSSLSLHTLPA